MEEILKSIKEEMKAKELEFERVKQDISTLEQNYKAALVKLESRYEQIRGAYTALNNQYNKFVENQETQVEVSEKENTQNNEEGLDKDEVSDGVEDTGDVENDVDATNLTKSQIEKIKQIVPEKKEKQNESDVLDYLKDDYKNA